LENLEGRSEDYRRDTAKERHKGNSGDYATSGKFGTLKGPKKIKVVVGSDQEKP